MRKTYLIFLLIISANFSSYSQVCTRTISSFMKATGGYDINGSATLIQEQDNTLTLTFSNDFSTTTGPDVYVFLGTSFQDPSGLTGKAKYQIAPIKSYSGTQTYTIPDSISIGEYDWVLIHCKTFNHFWGGGMLGTLNGCATASVTHHEMISSLLISPNPSSGIFQVESISANETMTLKVFDMIGKEVFNQSLNSSLKNILDLSFLPEGLYLLKQNDGKSEIVEKIFIIK